MCVSYISNFMCKALCNGFLVLIQLMIPLLCVWYQQCKLGIVKFIEAQQVPEVETVVHLVVASSDTRHSVATAADLELKSKQRLVTELNASLFDMLYMDYHVVMSAQNYISLTIPKETS